MQALAKDCEALTAAYREIDRLRAGVVDLKAVIRTLEAQKSMALDHGTVPQNSTQVVDFIEPLHQTHVNFGLSDTGASSLAAPTKESVSII